MKYTNCRDISLPSRSADSNFLPTLALGIAWGAVLLHVLAAALPLRAQTIWTNPPDRSLTALQRLVDELKSGLSISEPVAVALVEANRRVMSVAAPSAENGPFQLSIDARFVHALTDDELSAALAHELGHVWVFTHHPYLQTERLANEVAMRVVTRDSLERLYSKVWAQEGLKGDLMNFLGPQPAITVPGPVTIPTSTSTDAHP